MRLAFSAAIAVAYLYGQEINQHVRFRALGDIKIPHNFQYIPTWSGNALVAIEDNPSALPVVRLFDQKGQSTTAITVAIPEAVYVEVRGASHGINGVTAICGAANDNDGRRSAFLALAAADGKIKSLIRVEPYSPTAVAVAPDGSIWTKGVEYLPIERKPSKTRNGILRQFDGSGKLIRSFLPQTDFSLKELFGGIDQLAVSSSRVGWYNGGGATSYFEIVNGTVERHPIVEPQNAEGRVSGLTITDDERAFVTWSVRGKDPTLFTLDRVSGDWHPVVLHDEGVPPLTNWLLGGTGKVLVFQTTEQSTWLRRMEESAQ